ncbi:hypothetical protein ACQJBY_023852 [Aegilops geniculata]
MLSSEGKHGAELAARQLKRGLHAGVHWLQAALPGFPPPLFAKHIRALLPRRHAPSSPMRHPSPREPELGLDKGFNFSKHFAKYELGEEVGCGHFGYTCAAKAMNSEHKARTSPSRSSPRTSCACFTLARLCSIWCTNRL